MIDLLLPRTDAGALVQVAVLVVVGSVGLAMTWRNAEFRSFVLGLVLCAAAWMALRTVH